MLHSDCPGPEEPESLIVCDCLIVLAHSITQFVQPKEPQSLNQIVRDCLIVLANSITQIVQGPESLIVHHSPAREFDSM